MIRKTLLISLLFVVCLISGCYTNPITGRDELMLVSEQQDFEIGKRYAPEVETQMGGLVPSPVLQNYVDSVGQKVAGVSQRPDYDYHFAALDHESMNAFALPGGYIFITRGMLEKLESEAQLAAILAHETAHVVARDTAAAMSRDIGINVVLSAVTSEETSGTLLTVTDVTNQILGLGYSREDEKTADLAGLDYMVAAGYNPNAMVETMKMLKAENDSRPIEFFSTHPNPENRIAYVEEKILLNYFQPERLRTGKEDYTKYVLDELE
jgi:predicted Zn-dependent protease